MISYNEAVAVLKEIALQSPVKEEECSLRLAAGRVLSREVVGFEDVPHFDNSAMDGFALVSRETQSASEGNPLRVPVSTFLAAGDVFEFNSQIDQLASIEIMTGAPLPKGKFDSVVRIEDVEVLLRNGEKEIVVHRPVRHLENVRLQGSDFRAGDKIAQKGEFIGAQHLMAFASLGIDKVWTRKPLKVAVLATGKELIEIGRERTNSAQIWNSSGPLLMAALKELGCEGVDLGIVADDEPETFRSLLRQGLQEGVDLFLSTGAVSKGKHDFVVEALKEVGAVVHFHKAAIRPGKPICFAEFPEEKAAFFGLPGNPVSTVVGFRFFVEPYLRARLGLGMERGVGASLDKDAKKPEGLRCFYKGRAYLTSDNEIQVEILEGQASYVVSSLLSANCWVVLPEEGSSVFAGSRVQIFSLDYSFRKGILS
jgi:molybdopterin molybdotransferase